MSISSISSEACDLQVISLKRTLSQDYLCLLFHFSQDIVTLDSLWQQS